MGGKATNRRSAKRDATIMAVCEQTYTPRTSLDSHTYADIRYRMMVRREKACFGLAYADREAIRVAPVRRTASAIATASA